MTKLLLLNVYRVNGSQTNLVILCSDYFNNRSRENIFIIFRPRRRCNMNELTPHDLRGWEPLRGNRSISGSPDITNHHCGAHSIHTVARMSRLRIR